MKFNVSARVYSTTRYSQEVKIVHAKFDASARKNMKHETLNFIF